MLTIRLRRVGRRNQPSYRVVITEHTTAAQGNYLEAVGHFNPRTHQLTVDQDRILLWLSRGAQPSERMAKLLTGQGMKHKLLTLPDYSRKPQHTPKKAAPAAPATAKSDSKITPPEPGAAPAAAEVVSDEALTESPASGSSDQVAQTTNESSDGATTESEGK